MDANTTNFNFNFSVIFDENVFLLLKVAYNVEFIFNIVILAVGIVGNVLSALIFTRSNFNKNTNTGKLYLFLCIFNLFSIFEAEFIESYSDVMFNYRLSLPCYMDNFMKRSLNQIVSWLQVLICFDRFILVIYPNKASMIRKKVYILISIRFNISQRELNF